jgi:hypothetical protein
MSGIVLKFPSDVSRRAHARLSRKSKNGGPDERAEQSAIGRVRHEAPAPNGPKARPAAAGVAQ